MSQSEKYQLFNYDTAVLYEKVYMFYLTALTLRIMRSVLYDTVYGTVFWQCFLLTIDCL